MDSTSPIATRPSPITVCIAGSTDRTRICASALFADTRFKITGVITPGPKPVGRKQIAEPNAMHIFATAHDRPLVIVEDKINEEIKGTVERVFEQPDILLVVDFGYLVPSWLLKFPTIAPLNVHPSQLPKYRGSSPGQYALLFGESESAVTIMVMDEKLDHGPIIQQLPFSVENTWKTPDYYKFAFDLTHENLADIVYDFVEKHLEPVAQADESPTPIAKHLKREDGFIPFQALQQLMHGEISVTPIPFLDRYQLKATSYQLYCLWRGFYPWPGLWTEIEVKGEKKRLKLLELHLEGDKLVLDQVQVEGKTPEPFTQFQARL